MESKKQEIAQLAESVLNAEVLTKWQERIGLEFRGTGKGVFF